MKKLFVVERAANGWVVTLFFDYKDQSILCLTWDEAVRTMREHAFIQEGSSEVPRGR